MFYQWDFTTERQRKQRACESLCFWFMTMVLLSLVSACAKKASGPLAYVTNERDGTITVIDTQTDQVVETIKVGARPRGIRFSPDGRRVYVALSTPSGQEYKDADNKIAAIDVESGQVVALYD